MIERDPERVTAAVIGGSGLYAMEGIEQETETVIETPFGRPSDVITVGSIGGVRCAFLPRHGRGHRISPSEINQRANMYALKSLGVERILAFAACGSLREDVRPRDIVIPDQVVDHTRCRASTFFADGIVAHVSLADPFCPHLRQQAAAGLTELGVRHHLGGSFVCIEGPQFSTRAESQVNRSHGFSIVGMTVMPEARLAREAEMCYVSVALVTDYDVWKVGEEVSADQVMESFTANIAAARALIRSLVPRIGISEDCDCRHALEHAVLTDPSAITPQARQRLALLIGKYLPGGAA